MSELTVILKDESRTCRQKFLVYNVFTIDPNDPEIIARIEEAKKNFQGEPEEITVRISMEIR